MIIPYVMKKCTKCGEWLVASSVNFRKQKGGKYGLRADCKECEKKYGKKYREENKEAIAKKNKKFRETHPEYSKKYCEQNKEAIAKQKKEYRKANKEAIVEYNKKYYEANRETIIDKSKRYYEAHKEAKAERSKKWYEANKEAIAERRKEHSKKYYEENKEAIAERSKKYRQTPQGQIVVFNRNNRRRAKEQNQGRGITKEQWLEMMSFFNWECAYSGKYLGGKTKDRSIDHVIPLNNGGENEIWNCIPMDRSLNSSKNDKEMLEWYIKQPFCTAERLLKIYKWQEYARNKYDNLIVNN